MDWILPVVLYLTLLALPNEVRCVRINTFNSFVGTNYEPTADFSLGQGAYVPNMPVASIYPMMTDETFQTMVGLPSLKQQSVPFLNPFAPTLPQNPTQMNKRKNSRDNNQRNLNHQQQGNNGPPKNRGVTLDVRGGGYKVEKHQNPKPYKAPNAESSVRNTQRYNEGRNSPPRNNGRQSNSPTRNRKPPNPRGPTMKNPHYNIKFETSLPSMPSNVEFVSPENVLPLHPRIYKQFLQQNKQYASYFPNINKPNQYKSHSGGNYGGSSQGNNNQRAKPSSNKPTRNRGNPLSSSFAQASQYSNFQSPGGEMSSPSTASGFEFFQQHNGGKPFNFDTDFFNQDPSFYSAFRQTPEGQAILSHIQKQAGGSNTPSRPKSQRTQNKPQQQTSHSNSPTYGSSTFLSGPGSQTETGVSPFTTNYFGASQGLGSNGAANVNHNQNPNADYQQMLMYYHQQMQQLSPQYTQSSGQSAFQVPASGSSYPPPNQQYASPQLPNNPFGEYQYSQGQSSHLQDQSQSFSHTPESTTHSKTKAHPYEKNNQPHSYQASHKDIKSQIPEFQTADHSEYTLPPFSPVEPLSTVENNNQEIHDYYGYHHTSSQHQSPPYSVDHSLQSFSQGALHEISPYTGEKTSTDHSIPTPNHEHKSASSPSGYLTPEQLFAPQSTGLQSEAKFGYPSAHGGLSIAASSINKESAENEAAGSAPNEHIEGSERAALHEYTVSYDPFSYKGSEKLREQNDFWKKGEVKNSSSESESESDEKLHETIHEFHKLITKPPRNSYMVPSNDGTYTPPNPTTAPVLMKNAQSTEESMKNHKTTPSYMFQYAPAEKTATKVPPTWHAWKPNASRYHLPLPETKLEVTTPIPPTTSTTPMPTTPQTTTVPTTTSSPETSTRVPLYHEPERPVCARSSGKNYCLQDPEYPKEKIKDAIEKNRHPLDHFLVDISPSTNLVEDTDLSKVFENSVPLQSTSISYSFEGKAISAVQADNSTAGCSSNVYYVKPLRAINTAGVWRTIVNVEFEETGANYTQTVRMEECSQTPGYVASCGHETISACLQKYKLQRLLSWEEHRGFYIDAFLLPHECFCGSQQGTTK